MDCKKLTAVACIHAVQNQRLPLRVVVQVLFFEQVRAATSPGSSTPDIPGNLRALLPRENGGSNGSSRTTMTNTEDDWNAVATAEELKALKGELASLRLGNGQSDKNGGDDRSINKAAATKGRDISTTFIFKSRNTRNIN